VNGTRRGRARERWSPEPVARGSRPRPRADSGKIEDVRRGNARLHPASHRARAAGAARVV